MTSLNPSSPPTTTSSPTSSKTTSPSTSTPSTLLHCDKQFSNFYEQNTRIPQPSPKLFQRSFSLRLRNNNANNGIVYPVDQQQQNTIHPCKSNVQHHCCNHQSVSTPTAATYADKKLNSSKLFLSFKTDSSVDKKNLIVAEKSPIQNNGDFKCSCNNQKTNNCTNNSTKLTLNKCGGGGGGSGSCSNEHHRNMQLNLTNGDGNCTRRQSTPQTTPSPIKTPNSNLTPNDLLRTVPKTPPVTPDSPDNCDYLDDDLDSVYSFASVASGRSTMSSCDHPFVARNGTTFSGRRMKYVVHCSNYAGQTGDDYLTPTQRAQRHIRKLKVLLSRARLDLEQRDSEILRLTKEVVELRLFKASLSSPEERSNSSDAVTVRENNDLKTSQDVSPIVDMTDGGTMSTTTTTTITTTSKSSPRHILLQNAVNQHQYIDKMNTSSSTSDMQLSSCADSGHFEDMATSSIHSKDSFVQTNDDFITASGGANSSRNTMSAIDIEEQRQTLIKLYEKRIEELIKKYDAETNDMKISHNDRVEALLQKLAECNTRYADLAPDYEQAKERIRELEKQLEDLQQKLQEQESKHNKMYLHMYTKGQEAERIAHGDKVLDFAQQAPNRVSVPELMQQLQITQNELENMRDTNYRPSQSGNSQVLLSAKEAISLWLLGARKTMYRRLIDAQQSKNKVDPEVTLQFLKSAIYYFLTDKENTQGHLNAIESILGFSDIERLNIAKARSK